MLQISKLVTHLLFLTDLTNHLKGCELVKGDKMALMNRTIFSISKS